MFLDFWETLSLSVSLGKVFFLCVCVLHVLTSRNCYQTLTWVFSCLNFENSWVYYLLRQVPFLPVCISFIKLECRVWCLTYSRCLIVLLKAKFQAREIAYNWQFSWMKKDLRETNGISSMYLIFLSPRIYFLWQYAGSTFLIEVHGSSYRLTEILTFLILLVEVSCMYFMMCNVFHGNKAESLNCSHWNMDICIVILIWTYVLSICFWILTWSKRKRET